MSAHVDMSIGPDMAMRVPNGVKCGATNVCPVGKDCCVTFANNMPTGATCITSGTQCMGASLMCDGPEDCNAAPTDACCAKVAIAGGGDAGAQLTGGSSMCGACMASFTGGMLTTRLCHAPPDCKNFALTVLGITVPFDKCCSTSATSGTDFCAPDPSVASQFGMTANYTCQ